MKATKLTSIAKQVLHERQDLEEIFLQGGDAQKSNSAVLLTSLLSRASSVVKAFEKKYGANLFNVWSPNFILDRTDGQTILNSRVDEKILNALLKYSVDQQGSYHVLRVKSDRTRHYLIDTSQPLVKLVIGRIDTEPSSGPYSMKTMFGIDGQVVHWSIVAEEYKGQGFGAFLYDKLLYLYGTLESDTVLYSGSYAMWTKHVPKKAKFFGATVQVKWGGGTQRGSNNIVIPITADEAADKKFADKVLGSFVAFEASVPAEVKKVASFVKGLSLRDGDYAIVDIRSAIDKKGQWGATFGTDDEADMSFMDLIQQGYSYADLCSMLDSSYGMNRVGTDKKIDPARTKKIIILFTNATAMVEPKGDIDDGEIEYKLL